MSRWRKVAKECLPLLIPFLWAGCNLTEERPGPWSPQYSIRGFTALADTAVALRVDLYELRWVPPNRNETRNERSVYLIAYRFRNRIRLLDGDLPRSAAPGLPDYFFACQDGTPVSLSAGGPKGAPGDCRTENIAASAGGRIALFGLASGSFQVLDADLKPLFRTPEPPPQRGWNSVLAADEDSGFVTLLERSLDDRGYWQRYPLDASAPADSVYLIWPTIVRIAGYGARVVCSEIDEAHGALPCWRAQGELGFADAARRYCERDCEWNPATGLLLARADYAGRFVFVEPRFGTEEKIELAPMLDSLARAGVSR